MMRSEQIPRIKEKILDAFRKQVFKKWEKRQKKREKGEKPDKTKQKVV